MSSLGSSPEKMDYSENSSFEDWSPYPGIGSSYKDERSKFYKRGVSCPLPQSPRSAQLLGLGTIEDSFNFLQLGSNTEQKEPLRRSASAFQPEKPSRSSKRFSVASFLSLDESDAASQADSDSDVSTMSTLSRSTVNTVISTNTMRQRTVNNNHEYIATTKRNVTSPVLVHADVVDSAAHRPGMMAKLCACVKYVLILLCCGVTLGSAAFFFGYTNIDTLHYQLNCQLPHADISKLRMRLNDNVYGQHIALAKVTKSLQQFFDENNHERAVVLSLHGWTGVGKNFVANLIVESFPAPNVFKLIVPLHFPHDSEGEMYAEQIQSWIQSNVARCSINVIILDEMDKSSPAVTRGLKHALISLKRRTDDNITSDINKHQRHVNKTVVLLLSNTGGSKINRITLEHLTSGISRDDLKRKDFQDVMTSPNLQSWSWHEDLYSEHVIDEFIPFLPLERRHVELCVQQYLRSRDLRITKTQEREILEQFEYFPVAEPLFSKSGCKRVADFAALIIE